MLTNLDWLSKGQTFPPSSETARLEQYRINELLFDSGQKEAYEKLYTAFANKVKKPVLKSVDTVINYQQLLSKKTADFVCGEPPEIEVNEHSQELERLLQRNKFNTKLYEAVIDLTRYGNAVWKRGATISAVQPKHWFPIVDETDLKQIKQHCIAYGIKPDEQGNPTELYAEVHNIGYYDELRFKLDKDGVIGTAENPVRHQTGLDDFAITVFTNVTHSGSIYGIDDYKPINAIVAQLIWRFHCVAYVLDKHSEPTMTGPRSALKFDTRTGLSYFDLGSFLHREDKNDPDLNYVTWDGSLESAFKEIELLTEQLYTLSEMGQAFLVGGGGGEADSGTALKLKMVAPRIKAARIASLNDDEIKQTISIMAMTNGINISADDLQILWQDGLPDDEKEQMETLMLATGGRPVMSLRTALRRLGFSPDQIDDELDEIASDQSQSMPSLLSVFDKNAFDDMGIE